MALLGLVGSTITGEISKQVGLRLLLLPLGSNIVIKTACCTVGTALPVYSTFKAIENNDRNEQDRWLIYWAAYGSFSLVEVFSDKVLYWFPLYYYMKFGFLVWLQLPSGNGSKHLYARHLRPFLQRRQARLDQILSFTSREIAKFTSTHEGEIQFLVSLLKRCAVTANQMVMDIIQPSKSGRLNAIEGPNAPVGQQQLRDSESDHDD